MLLDTSGLLLLFDVKSRQHAETSCLFHRAHKRVTHSYVVAEFIALAGARGYARPRIFDFVRTLHRGPLARMMYVDRTLHLAAIEFLSRRLDKQWSLCDAVSFLIMQARGITEALTTDHDFEQAGFRRLLSS